MNPAIAALKKTIPIFLFVILNIWSGAGCQTKTLEKAQSQSIGSEIDALSGAKKIQSPYCISLGSGGGFTGLYTGYHLYQDGRIEHWQRFSSGRDTVLWTYHHNDSAVTSFKNRLINLGMLNKRIQESGNMNTHVSLELPDTTYRWYWSRTTDTSLVNWTHDVEKFCREIENEHFKK